MNQLIACCGLDCESCDARIATLTNNNALREKTAALWTKLNGVTITPEMINCTGCRVDGAKTPFCDKLCSVHNCVREKRLDTCVRVDVLDHAGILCDVKSTHSSDADLVTDKNVISARANAYFDFAVEVAKKLDLFASEDDLQETINFWKHYQRVQ